MHFQSHKNTYFLIVFVSPTIIHKSEMLVPQKHKILGMLKGSNGATMKNQQECVNCDKIG